ncbi:hypothetical protein CGQ24_09870 [Arthrobacter sp. 7749]|nr:hypothetical protein CGQ24_09870 [Arthrobacter sp. 7749]
MGSHRWADLVARGRSNSVPGAGLIDPTLEAAAHNGSTVRIQLELASAPSASTLTNRFTPGEPAHTQFTADARTAAVSGNGRWVRAAVPVRSGNGKDASLGQRK